MTEVQFSAMMDVLSTLDRRMRSIERDISDSAAAMEGIAEAQSKLTDLYLAVDQKLDENATVMANYVDATKGLREETRRLHSDVRQKLKAV